MACLLSTLCCLIFSACLRAEPPNYRLLRGIVLGSPTTLYSPQVGGGQLDVRPGEFSAWLPFSGAESLVLHRVPPDAQGNFSDAGISIPLSGVAKILLVVTGTGNNLRAKAYPEQASAAGDVTLLNYSDIDLDYRLGDKSGMIAPEECAHERVPPPSGPGSDLVSLSLAPGAGGKSSATAKNVQLRLLKDTHVYLFVVRARDPEGKGFLPGIIDFEFVYDPIAQEHNAE